MPLLNEQQMINKINKIIDQQSLGPEYRVRSVRKASWGLLAYWIPQGAEKHIAGEGPYMCSNNGTVKSYSEVAGRNNINPQDVEAVVQRFIFEAENKTRV